MPQEGRGAIGECGTSGCSEARVSPSDGDSVPGRAIRDSDNARGRLDPYPVRPTTSRTQAAEEASGLRGVVGGDANADARRGRGQDEGRTQQHSKTHSKSNICNRKRNKTNDLATFWTENTIKYNRCLQQTPTINSRNRDLQ